MVNISYIFKTRTSSNNITKLFKWGRNGTTEATTFNYHWKSIEHLDRDEMKNLIFNRGYNRHILFRNSQMKSLTCRKRGTLKTHYPLWSTVMLLYYTRTIPLSREHLLWATGGCAGTLCWSWPENLHQYTHDVNATII